MWRFVVGELDCGQLMFVDEMGTHTSLAPLYGYSPRGKRAFFKVPRNRGKNTTLLASIGREGMGPSMVVEGSTSGISLRGLCGALSGSHVEGGASGGDGQLERP